MKPLMKKASTSRSRNLPCIRETDHYKIYTKTREFHFGETLSFYMNKLSGVIGKFLFYLMPKSSANSYRSSLIPSTWLIFLLFSSGTSIDTSPASHQYQRLASGSPESIHHCLVQSIFQIQPSVYFHRIMPKHTDLFLHI